MKTNQLITTLFISFCLSNITIAAEIDTPPKQIDSTDIDYSHTNEEFSQCGIKKTEQELLAAAEPEPSKTAEISYVTGGICAEEVEFMKGIARHFPLEVVFVLQEQGKEVYLADVNVTLQNDKQEEVLSVVTEGPFLFVNLPNGKYTINATYHNVEQVKKVNITKKHSRIVFLWKEDPMDNATLDQEK